MKEIKIVVIDDSNIVHVLLNRVLSRVDGLHVAGNAHNGQDGISMVKKLSPDIIIMDITMPGMNGLEAISIIMEEKPTPIIVFSAASKKIVDLSFKAIDLGAVEIIEKPFAEDVNILQEIIHDKLIRSIKTFADFKVIRRIKKSTMLKLKQKADDLSSLKASYEKPKKNRTAFTGTAFTGTALTGTALTGADVTSDNVTSTQIKPEADIYQKPSGDPNFLIVAIASSTGGPQTVKQLLTAVSYKSAPCSYIIIQHMAMGFIKGFCDWINMESQIPAEIAQDDVYVHPNKIYIAPEGHHLIINHEFKFRYNDDPPVKGIRPAADILFMSLAPVFKERTIAIVLTGMGSDGSAGIIEIKKNGGYVIAQDEASCYIFGMPKAAIETGATDKVLSIYEMPNFLEKLYNERYTEHR